MEARPIMNAADIKHKHLRIILCGTMLIALAVTARLVPAQSTDEREFVGTINKTLRVRIRLSQSGKVLRGSYAYERIGKSLRLAGEMTFENEFHLDEFDERGTKTGTFEGKFVSRDWLEGTWSSTSTKRQLYFTAKAIDGKQIPAANADDRVSGQYKRVDEKGRLDEHSAVLNVWLLKDGEVRVRGFSSWVGNSQTGDINVGNVEGLYAVQGSKVFFRSGDGDDRCHFTILFGRDSLRVMDDNRMCGGSNVLQEPFQELFGESQRRRESALQLDALSRPNRGSAGRSPNFGRRRPPSQMNEGVRDGALHPGIRFRLPRTLQSIASRGDTDRAEHLCGQTAAHRATNLQNIIHGGKHDVTRLNECGSYPGA